MSHSFLIPLLVAGSTFASARHMHQRANHQHEARQVSPVNAVPVFTQAPVATPISAPAPPSQQNIGKLADQLESCLNSIPNDISVLMAAIDKRLGDVQDQVSSLLNGDLPTSGLSIATPTPQSPSLGIPPPSVSPPYPPISSVPSVAPPAISIPSLAVPSLSVPSITLPNLTLPSLALPTVPSVSVPSVSVPSISVPAVSLPSVSAPTIATSISPVSAISLPSPSLPTTAVPPFSLPVVSLPSPSLPTTSVPAFSLPVVSLPSPSLPTTSVPAFSLPVVSLPSPSLPTTAVPPFSAPAVSFALPTFQFVPPISNPTTALPSTAIPSAPSPPAVAVTLPSVQLPSAPAVSTPGISVPSLSLPVAGGGSVVSPGAPSVTLPTGITTLLGVTTRITLPTSLTTRVSVPSLPVSLPTAIPTQFINTIPQNFTTVTDLISSTRLVSNPTETPYSFNADARDGLAVYYGNTPATGVGGLAQLCTNRNVDIVVLSFVYDFFTANGYPSIYFGTTSCISQNAAQAARAPGLRDCTPLAQQITLCQAVGKKVLVSLGGYVANSTFTSDLEARKFAVTLWNLFGAGDQDSDLRPFGSTIVDGFDIDNESGKPDHWDTFASAMRALFNSDASKQYYLSAAPQCPYPDASIPLGAMQNADFIWTQFYNNPSCNLDSDGFLRSFSTWSNALADTTTPTRPKLYIGAPAFAGAGSGYVDSSGLSSRISLAKSLFKNNFGGIMLWDGSEALINVDSLGHSYLDYAKWSLQY